MFDTIGTASIALGSVVLDRPDQTGRYFARDLAGGWAYLVGDAEGDSRFRGHGACDGGLDLTLRCAFLSAISRIPECGQIKILVETRHAHRMIVQLARNDPHVVAAIGGRPVQVMTRPDERSSCQVRSAAERAASTALRDREQAEWHAAELGSGMPTEAEGIEAKGAMPEEAGAMRAWHMRRAARNSVQAGGSSEVRPKPPASPASDPAIRRLIGPLMQGARDRLAAAGLLAPSTPRHSLAVTAWLQEFDRSVAAVASDLQDAGA